MACSMQYSMMLSWWQSHSACISLGVHLALTHMCLGSNQVFYQDRIADANGWSRSSYTGFWNKHGRGQRAVIWKGPSPLWIPLFRLVLALPFISEQMTDLPGSVVPTSASLSLVPIWRKVIKAFLLFVYLLYVFVHSILRPPSPAVCPYSLHRWELSFV